MSVYLLSLGSAGSNAQRTCKTRSYLRGRCWLCAVMYQTTACRQHWLRLCPLLRVLCYCCCTLSHATLPWLAQLLRLCCCCVGSLLRVALHTPDAGLRQDERVCTTCTLHYCCCYGCKAQHVCCATAAAAAATAASHNMHPAPLLLLLWLQVSRTCCLG
jgi:hypothetical protein